MAMIVIDVGTSSMRGIVYDDNARVVEKVQKHYRPVYVSDIVVEQDASQWLHALMTILAELAEKAENYQWEIEGIAVTAQRTSVLPVDAEGNPLQRVIMWQDKRNAELCDSMQEYSSLIYEKCMFPINTISSAGKMAWIKKYQSEIYREAYKLIVPVEYLLFHMTGKMLLDHTYASRSLLMNIQDNQWDEELLKAWQIDREKLNDLVEPGAVCGFLTREMAEKTGLKEGIPVISCGGDQQCSAVGQGTFQNGVLSVTCGTGAFLCMDTERIDDAVKGQMNMNRSSISGHFIMESTMNSCTAAFDWFRKEFMPEDSYEKLNEMIGKNPEGRDHVTVLPYFQGRSNPDWNVNAKGAFLNLSLSTTKEDILRGLIEGIANEISNQVELFEKVQKIEAVYAGGGLSASNAFCSMLANACGRRIVVTKGIDETANGAYMVAAKTLGLFHEYQEAYDRLIEDKERIQYEPEVEKAEVIQKDRRDMNEIYQKLYEKN